MINIKSFIVFLAATFGFLPECGALDSSKPILHLTTLALPPLSSTQENMGFLERVAKEAFRRIGYKIEVAVLPGERSLINSDAGLDDGDLMRAPGFEKAFPNLIQVPEKIGDMDFMMYSLNPNIRPIEWHDLKSYAVGYPSGWKIYDRNVKAREVVTVRDMQDLFQLLKKDRVDLVLADRWQGLYAAKSTGVAIILLETPLATSPMYIYLNKKHAALVKDLAASLAGMKEDGSYRKIFNDTLLPYNQMSH